MVESNVADREWQMYPPRLPILHDRYVSRNIMHVPSTWDHQPCWAPAVREQAEKEQHERRAKERELVVL